MPFEIGDDGVGFEIDDLFESLLGSGEIALAGEYFGLAIVSGQKAAIGIERRLAVVQG